jgi:GNAT superfamily N-acetyltransferase
MPTKPRILRLHGAPAVKGLVFRTYRGREDIPAMLGVVNPSLKADIIDVVAKEEDLRRDFEAPTNMDPYKDIIMAEVDDELIGFSEMTWRQRLRKARVYVHYSHLLPEWRGKGVREAMLHYCEKRLVQKARKHPGDQTKYFEIYANSQDNDWKRILESEGYKPNWYVLELARPDLDKVPDLPLPPGIEVRPVMPEHYHKIWDSAVEALKDENSFLEERNNENAYQRQLASSTFMPRLWQIAWEGEEVVGGVHNYIDEDENKAYRRRWGHTEKIFVRRPWRNRGIAKALISRSLKVLREEGMEAATLDVDSDNPSGALKLYESMGYRLEMEFTFYKKPID